VQQVYLCTLLVAVGRVQFDWIHPQIVTHLSELAGICFIWMLTETAIWPTPHVQNNVFAGCRAPENGWLAIGIAFLSALDPKLHTIMFNSAAILESNVADTRSSK